jgi:hypothetical protein
MTTFDLYFVGWHKHGNLQHLAAGPFIDWEEADTTRKRLGDVHYVVVVATMAPPRMEILS